MCETCLNQGGRGQSVSGLSCCSRGLDVWGFWRPHGEDELAAKDLEGRLYCQPHCVGSTSTPVRHDHSQRVPENLCPLPSAGRFVPKLQVSTVKAHRPGHCSEPCHFIPSLGRGSQRVTEQAVSPPNSELSFLNINLGHSSSSEGLSSRCPRPDKVFSNGV